MPCLLGVVWNIVLFLHSFSQNGSELLTPKSAKGMGTLRCPVRIWKAPTMPSSALWRRWPWHWRARGLATHRQETRLPLFSNPSLASTCYTQAADALNAAERGSSGCGRLPANAAVRNEAG